MSLAQAIADAPVPEYNKIKVPLLCVAGQEDQVAQLEDLALIGDEYVKTTIHTHPYTPFPTVALICFPHMPALEHAMHACHAHAHAMPIVPCNTYKTSNVLILVPADGARPPRRSSRCCSASATGTPSKTRRGWRGA